MWPEPAARSARHVLRRICSACSQSPCSNASLLLTLPASLSLNLTKRRSIAPRTISLRPHWL